MTEGREVGGAVKAGGRVLSGLGGWDRCGILLKDFEQRSHIIGSEFRTNTLVTMQNRWMKLETGIQ